MPRPSKRVLLVIASLAVSFGAGAADFSMIQQDFFSGLGPPFAFGVVSDGTGFWAAASITGDVSGLARY